MFHSFSLVLFFLSDIMGEMELESHVVFDSGFPFSSSFRGPRELDSQSELPDEYSDLVYFSDDWVDRNGADSILRVYKPFIKPWRVEGGGTAPPICSHLPCARGIYVENACSTHSPVKFIFNSQTLCRGRDPYLFLHCDSTLHLKPGLSKLSWCSRDLKASPIYPILSQPVDCERKWDLLSVTRDLLVSDFATNCGPSGEADCLLIEGRDEIWRPTKVLRISSNIPSSTYSCSSRNVYFLKSVHPIFSFPRDS